ncbi:MAG: DMT family transporter [Lachnospiraceae bacterium]|nr:DMT family transporter [Lachnospiraceae bacterium]
MIGFFIALLSGAMMSVQGVWNTGVTKQTSLWVANGFVQITAFAVCMAGWFLEGRHSVLELLKVSPKYYLLGGILGACITWTVIQSMSSLGPAKATMLIVIAQLAVSYLIELAGIFGVERTGFVWHKLIGVLIMAGGIVLFQWGSES